VFYYLCLQRFEKGSKKSETQKRLWIFSRINIYKLSDEKDKIDLMFRFIQYIERQIVLFDAVEDAAFLFNNMEGRGSLRDIKKKQRQR
jgi:phosphoenolpyruvate carboxylase